VQATALSAQAAGPPSLKLHQNVERVERETIRRALEMSTLKRHAATLLGITPRALAYYLAKYPFIERNNGDRGRASSVTQGF
jgi:transcriptional regulator with GAF, ATPase, and Fis domain